ncbi:PAS domain S-box-containing protein [Algoriphagus sp. 4150]|uniref:sensor histidine kinase n=1 Tax=Algoriphagus sp. 4150 TaxID=2817756 RepID=UPI0028645F49|nr:ATP-binding protein [Algoriphagus sp. 4150]MDR7130615.1 PAS domain S-box-containing protein [Algoriphagus sp. 4150]
MKDYSNTQASLNEYRSQRMIDEVQDYAIILLDTEGNIQNWNKGAEKIKGYLENEILGQNFSVFYLPVDREEGLPSQLIGEARVNGRARQEGWRVRKDGSVFWGNIVITALHDRHDKVIGFTKVTCDLTEWKLAEEQKESDAKSMALQNKQLEEFAYVTSHDLQEPIRKIQAFVDLARIEIDNREDLEWCLEKIDSTAEKMIQLIKDILAFSKISHDHVEFSDVDLNSIVAEVLSEYEVLIAEKRAKTEVSNLPIIKGVPVQIYQLFSNLISNALKFNHGEPHVIISYTLVNEQDFPQLSYAHLVTIADNGVGFDQRNADLAFEPFRRFSSEFSGTGIGLALCKRIVENHKGMISVQTEPGQGTTFNIFF